MLGSVRRFGVAQALRATVPRSLYARSTPQLVQWQSPSTAIPQIARSPYHSSPIRAYSVAAEALKHETEPESSERLTEFADLGKNGLIDRRVISTITNKMKISTMTEVQSLTINETVDGGDVLAQAKTGTGKTLAFLLPVIQRILNDTSVQLNARDWKSLPSPSDIRAIIISPTRELAEQIAVEAQKLTRGTGITTQLAVGGTRKHEGLMRIRREGCHMLIGTPGRLKDILSDPRSGVQAPKLAAFVLDEADRLLDDGFAPEIQEIQNLLPSPMKVDRQTLLFSATVPREVMGLVRRTMKPDFKFVKTVKDDEVPTHLTVPQKAVLLNGFENFPVTLLEFAKQYRSAARENPDMRPFKAIVYFNSTAQTHVHYKAFTELLQEPGNFRSGHPLRGMGIVELHSRLTQSRRTNSAEAFRRMKSAILFSSDVTARGMDFPDVTHVIQLGTPRDTPTYIHRLGRTARANKTGEGWMFLHPGEISDFRQKLGSLPISKDSDSFPIASVDMTQPTIDLSPSAEQSVAQMKAAFANVDEKIREDAYMGQMGTLNGTMRKQDMISALNDLSKHGYGLDEPPQLSPRIAQTMGLDRVGGVRTRSYEKRGFGGGFGRDARRDFARGYNRNSGLDSGRGYGRDSGRNRGRSRNDRGSFGSDDWSSF